MKTFGMLLIATTWLTAGCSSSTPTYCGDAGFQDPGLVCEQWLKALVRLCGTDGGCLYDGGGAGCDLAQCPNPAQGVPNIFCQPGGTVEFAALCDPAATTDLGLILDAGSCQALSPAVFVQNPVCDGQSTDLPK